MACMPGGRLRIAPVALLAMLALHVPNRTFAKEDGQDAASVATLLHEATTKIHDTAYRTESRAVICTKALRGLIQQLGENAKSFDRDLGTLQDDAAEAEFVKILQSMAAMPGQRYGLRELAERSIQAWCKQHDPYTRYTRSDDVRLVQLMMAKATGSGVGMTVMDKDAVFQCYPLPGSPAEAGGVIAGDRLISVDGKPVEGKPLSFAIAAIRGGPPGSEVLLRVAHGFGREQTLRLTREALTTPTVLVEKKLSGMILRVRKFNNDLAADARAALAQLSPGASLTLDLRGCPGGNLDRAVDFAAMFLEAGEPIVTVRSRDRADEVISATKPREFKPAAIICLQDGGTASAAELVIAALVNSKTARAASQGQKSYGKGVLQTAMDLRGGGHLEITSGELIAPQGRTWDKTGLLPSVENRERIFPKE
jgi:carboxyl-terminal processing protease